jgi:hypothetical protein
VLRLLLAAGAREVDAASATVGVSAGRDGLRCTRRHARDPDTRGGCHLAAQDRSAFANVRDFSPDESRETVLGSLTPPVGVEALHNVPHGRGVWRNMLDDRNTNNLAGDHQNLFGLIAIAHDALEDRT